jgi:hypothetical protein
VSTLKNETLISIYEEILNGKRRSFPMGTWKIENGGQKNLLKLLRYLLLEKLSLTSEEIKQTPAIESIFEKYKLIGGLHLVYKGQSMYKCIMDAIPEWDLKPWELACAPMRLWKDDKNVEAAVKWLLEEKGQPPCRASFVKYGLDKMVSLRFNGNTEEAIAIAYPDIDRVHISAKVREMRSGVNSHVSKLSLEQLENLRNERERGSTIKALGAKYGLSTGSVCRIVNNKSYVI